ncbi:hypothetical protein [Micromonospora sp. NBS 11-29]|uniref:hypothetical protein n=1 Tax=Micromonospora sp. NBS 11-29 TaxID=1960879 RepID=UPI0015948ED9|nr:hypothetical protein [Micromonospora sp. NBS 11-29]
MTEPDEAGEDTGAGEPIEAPPTANPSRVQVPPEGLTPQTPTSEGDPGPSGPPAEET